MISEKSVGVAKKRSIMVIAGISCLVLSLAVSGSVGGLTFGGYGWILAALGCFSLAVVNALGVRCKRQKGGHYPWPRKMLHWLTGAVVLIISIFLVTQGLLLATSTSRKVPSDVMALVPGAGIVRKEPSFTLAGRLNAAAVFLKQYPETSVVLTGGHSDGQLASEAQVMAWYLERHGIDSERLILEEKASNTLENITYAVEIMREIEHQPVEAVLIITSDYHLLRSLMLARRFGLRAYGITAASPAPLYRQYAVREFFAIFKSMIFDWPRYH